MKYRIVKKQTSTKEIEIDRVVDTNDPNQLAEEIVDVSKDHTGDKQIKLINNHLMLYGKNINAVEVVWMTINDKKVYSIPIKDFDISVGLQSTLRV